MSHQGWHIRLHTKVGNVEVWCLYNGDKQESSPVPKSFAEKWLTEELKKEETNK